MAKQEVKHGITHGVVKPQQIGNCERCSIPLYRGKLGMDDPIFEIVTYGYDTGEPLWSETVCGRCWTNHHIGNQEITPTYPRLYLNPFEEAI